jgi:hypothetical protein
MKFRRRSRVGPRPGKQFSHSSELLVAPILLSFLVFLYIPSYPLFHLFAFFWHLLLQEGAIVDSRIGPHAYPFYLSLLAYMKNEGDYLPEWIEYHLLVGFQYFWLVDNGSTDNSTAVLRPYFLMGIVNVTTFLEEHGQSRAYNMMLPFTREQTFWLAIIDIDEFLVPLRTHSVSAVLHDLENEVGIRVHWVRYGSNGQRERKPGLVIERFRDHTAYDDPVNQYTKNIVNPRMTEWIGVHRARYTTGLQTWESKPQVYDFFRVNHYFTKSYEEWLIKTKRGKGQSKWPYKVKGWSTIIDDVKNDTLIDWSVPFVKRNLIHRFNGSDSPYVQELIGRITR